MSLDIFSNAVSKSDIIGLSRLKSLSNRIGSSWVTSKVISKKCKSWLNI